MRQRPNPVSLIQRNALSSNPAWSATSTAGCAMPASWRSLSGGGLLAIDGYHAHQDATTEATVTALEIACVLTGNSTLTSAYQKDVECSDADGIIAANAKLPLAVREITFARLSYQIGKRG